MSQSSPQSSLRSSSCSAQKNEPNINKKVKPESCINKPVQDKTDALPHENVKVGGKFEKKQDEYCQSKIADEKRVTDKNADIFSDVNSLSQLDN